MKIQTTFPHPAISDRSSAEPGTSAATGGSGTLPWPTTALAQSYDALGLRESSSHASDLEGLRQLSERSGLDTQAKQTSPFEVATAAQNQDLMGSTKGASVFHTDAKGSPEVKASDVHQDINLEGDCQTLSVLASVAADDPKFIQDNIQQLGKDDKGNNRYAVKLFVDNKWTTQEVSDADLPGKGALQKTDVIWPRLYEAAIIKAFPGDDVLNKHLVDHSQPDSGKPAIDTGKVLTAVTGKPLKAGDGGEAANKLLDAVKDGSPATAGVASGTLSNFGSYETINPQTGEKADPSSTAAVTLLGSHQYAVLGVTGDAPNRQVQIFNSYNYPGKGGSDFTVHESVFRKFFEVGLAWT